MTLAARTLAPLDRPKHLREQLKPDMARAARLAREAAGISQRDLAEQLDAQPAHIARTELDAEPHALTLVHVAVGPSDWAEVLVRWAAAKHALQVLRAARIVHGDDHPARLAAVVVQLTDVLRAFSAALADGHLSDAELELLERESREAVDALLELQRYATETLQARRAGR